MLLVMCHVMDVMELPLLVKTVQSTTNLQDQEQLVLNVLLALTLLKEITLVLLVMLFNVYI